MLLSNPVKFIAFVPIKELGTVFILKCHICIINSNLTL